MKYLRRGIWYLAGRLFLCCAVLGLAILVFYYAMNFANIQVVLKDGFASRAKVITGIEDSGESLSKYFNASYLQTDSQLNAALNGKSAYADYKVVGIDHRLEMSFLWLWPWETNVRVTVTETVPKIDGRVKGTRADAVIAARGPEAVYPPSWTGTRYKVSLIRESGQWKIRNMTVLETLE